MILRKIEEFRFEGIIAKKIDSVYTLGQKSSAWLKKKIKQTDEFVIGGFIPDRAGIEELVVGKYRDADLIYVASFRNGFVPATRETVFKALKPLITVKCPFANLPEKKGTRRMDAKKMRKARWVKPALVAEVAFNEWTHGYHLRHAQFIRLRRDKTPEQVSRFLP